MNDDILLQRAPDPSAANDNFPRGGMGRADQCRATQRDGCQRDDPEELAGTDPTEQAAGRGRRRRQARGDGGRRAARARLRPDAGQCAAAHSAVVAAGRRGDVGPYRRRAARVLVDPGRARGRHRHRAQHQGHRHQDAGRRPQAHGGEEAGTGTGHRRRHPDGRRHRRAQSGPRALHPRRGRRDPHGVHGQYRQGLRADRPQPSGRRADRTDPGRQPVLAGTQGLLQGREHPRGPDPRLRQAHDADRDQRRGEPRTTRSPMRRASCRTSSTCS